MPKLSRIKFNLSTYANFRVLHNEEISDTDCTVPLFQWPLPILHRLSKSKLSSQSKFPLISKLKQPL